MAISRDTEEVCRRFLTSTRFALGGGGRYDGLLGRYGRDLPACGLALDLQAVHSAQAEEERLG